MSKNVTEIPLKRQIIEETNKNIMNNNNKEKKKKRKTTKINKQKQQTEKCVLKHCWFFKRKTRWSKRYFLCQCLFFCIESVMLRQYKTQYYNSNKVE